MIQTPNFAFFPRDVELPEGWCLNQEILVLFTTAYRMPDDASILELGSWVGRSTCTIALGLRESRRRVRFDVVDFGVTGAGEWKTRFDQDIDDHPDAERIKPIIEARGGTGAVLKQNLVDRGLAGFISLLIFGDISDYAPSRRYDFIYCDASHDEDETRRSIELIKPMLKGEFVLICDDVRSQAQADTIIEVTAAEHYFPVSSLDPCSRMGVFTKGARFRNYLYAQDR